jgi:hypothetical protein
MALDSNLSPLFVIEWMTDFNLISSCAGNPLKGGNIVLCAETVTAKNAGRPSVCQ